MPETGAERVWYDRSGAPLFPEPDTERAASAPFQRAPRDSDDGEGDE